MSSLYAWRRRTRHGNIRACGAHSRTSNTDTKLLIYSLFQKGRVLAQDGVADGTVWSYPVSAGNPKNQGLDRAWGEGKSGTGRDSIEFLCGFAVVIVEHAAQSFATLHIYLTS